MKQPSPLTIHQDKYCSSCSDQATCNPRTPAGRERLRLCFGIMELQYFDFFAEGLLKLNQNLEASNKVFSQILVEQQRRPAQSQTTQQSQPQSTPVQRNTRPTQGHMEGGITWIWDENRSNERYEKALEKDNQRSEAFFALRSRILAKVNAGKKGLEENGKWHWISEREDFIGRKPAKQCTRGK